MYTKRRKIKNSGILLYASVGLIEAAGLHSWQYWVYDLIKDGRTVILPDFCGKCQLSDELAVVIPKDKILNIDCSDSADVFKTLKDHTFRHKIIDSIPEEFKKDTEDYVQELLEIDEMSKPLKDTPSAVIGTGVYVVTEQ